MNRITSPQKLAIVLAFVATASALPHPAVRQDNAWRRNGVKGPTVKYIFFKDGTADGTSLNQQPDGTWTLEGGLGYEAGLKVAFRDEWSVYFSTVPKFSNGRSMSADLWRGEIRFKPSTSKDWNSAVAGYQISLADTNARAAPTKPWLENGINGRTVTQISFLAGWRTGKLTQQADGTWTLDGNFQRESGLKESGRDEWSVYFSSIPKFSLGKPVVVDLWTGYLRSGSESYNIVSAGADSPQA